MGAAKDYALEPKEVERIETANRRIVTKFPVPESIPMLEKLRASEPRSMSGQPPVVWDLAEGVHVFDRWGNKWLDWSSGVLVTCAGHGRPEIVKAVVEEAQKPLLHSYCFPNEARYRLSTKLVQIAPDSLNSCFLLTTGSEATENAIKLSKAWAMETAGPEKRIVVTFAGAFHGRTLAAQLAGGIPALKTWIAKPDDSFVNVPFPGHWRTKDKSFDGFLKALEEKGAKQEDVCMVMTETYQGGTAEFLPVEFVKKLREWCSEKGALLVFDEVQAAFGRTGTMWGFEHYGVEPDITCCGKGITSSLPLSAVIGRKDILDVFPPGSMTSTHSGSPLCCAAAVASIDVIINDGLVENSAKVGEKLLEGLRKLQEKYSDRIGCVAGKGLVAAAQMVQPGSDEPDGDAAWNVVARCVERGLLMFSPVGSGGASVKIAPPLVTTAEQIAEGIEVLGQALAATLT